MSRGRISQASVRMSGRCLAASSTASRGEGANSLLAVVNAQEGNRDDDGTEDETYEDTHTQTCWRFWI